MIILSTSAEAQTLKVIPREYVSYFVAYVRDDSTNVTKTYFIENASQVGNYLQFTNAFNLVENHFYDLTLEFFYSRVIETGGILESPQCLIPLNADYNMFSEIIYKDRIFCTDQNVTDNKMYDINKDQYNNYNGYDNEYIVR